MQDRRVLYRYISFGLLALFAYLIATGIAGALREALLHVKVFNPETADMIKEHALHGYYAIHVPVWAAMNHDGLSIMAIGAFLFISVFAFIKAYAGHDRRQKYKQRHGYASHGTAHWQEKHEARSFYHADNRGILLGDYDKDVYNPLHSDAFDNPKAESYSVHPFSSPLNQQYLIFGPPGSQKTTGFILPNIYHLIQQGISQVITDPKGELFELTAEYAKQQGFKVVVLDYLWFKYGHRQNLINYIFAEEQYAELASMYLGATRNEGDKRDFWEEKAQELFSALIGFVHQAYGENGTLADVYRLVPQMTDPDYALQLFKKHKVQGAPMEFLRGVLAAAKSENTMSGIVSTLSGKLQLFALTNVRSQSARTDFDLRYVADQRTIVYVWISDSQRTYSPIISAFWTVLFNTLYERARQTGGKLSVPIACLMDEMANIGKIADFDTKLTTMRSRRIYPMMIWHSYPQLKLKYGQDYADAIMGACDTKVILACNDMPTADLFSKMLGDTTIETESKRVSKGIIADGGGGTAQFAGRRLMQPSELMALDRRFSVISQSGRPPVLLNKLQYRYWEYLICPMASKEELPTYVLDEEDVLEVDESEQTVGEIAAGLMEEKRQQDEGRSKWL